MNTEVLRIELTSPDPAVIARAAELLRAGRMVAFPTETVYGLGANALDPDAVRGIFAAKGRPADNPVIVHVAEIEGATEVASSWPETAARLAGQFWPGPLTFVLPKRETIPEVVTAGGSTVAVRMPAHPVALALIRAAGVPVAAPSANRSSELSPTRAGHVLRGLDGRIDLVLDGGPAPGGIESTVLDLTSARPRLLRPGLVTIADIERIIGPIQVTVYTAAAAGPLPSPGMSPRHYAPRTPLELAAHGAARTRELCAAGLWVGWLAMIASDEGQGVTKIVMPDNPRGYAAALYAALHLLDEGGHDCIVVELPPNTEEWLAVRDRLRRAAHPSPLPLSPSGERGRGEG